MESKFRVAICGGGIGGLSLAFALAQYSNIAIDLYEAAARFEDIGAGIGLWGRGVSVLRKLGVEERIHAIATAPPGNEDCPFELRRSDRLSEGEVLGQLNFSVTLGLHRSQLIALLASMLADTGRVNLHFKKRCVSFTQAEDDLADTSSKEPVTLRFADETFATCDVLIGCDGIKSVIRRTLHEFHQSEFGASEQRGGYSDLQFSGAVAYRALVKSEELEKINDNHSAVTVRKLYCGKRKHVVTYPLGGGKIINFIGYSSDRSEKWGDDSWVAEADHQELADQYAHFEQEVQDMIKCIDKSSRWALYDVEPREFWSRGRVTLLGDAAHATTPFIGSGGGQVLEDVYVLSRLLGSDSATRATLPSVLLAYESVRRPRANEVVRCSREALQVYELLGEYEDATNEEVAGGLRKLTEWLSEGKGDPDDDVLEAERVLQGILCRPRPSQ